MSQGVEVLWLEQTIADVPTKDEWLAASEQHKLRAFRVPKRASDWRLGRWTAKRVLARSLGLSEDHSALAAIEIVPADSGAPLAFLSGEPSGWRISISHSGGHAACAVTRGPVSLGCDLERIAPRGQAFVADYFTEEEQIVIARSATRYRDILHTLFWSAKESALKAMGEGLRLDTRSVSVTRVGCPSLWSLWAPLAVGAAGGKLFEGWWRSDGKFVRTVVSQPECAIPKSFPAGRACMGSQKERDTNASALTHATAD